MKMISYRMCCITRNRKKKEELLKITRINNKWKIDQENKLFGRSIYIELNKINLKKFSCQQQRFKIDDQNFQELCEKLKELCEENI